MTQSTFGRSEAETGAQQNTPSKHTTEKRNINDPLNATIADSLTDNECDSTATSSALRVPVK